MSVMDPWRVLMAVVHLAATGFSPFVVPFVVYLDFFVSEEAFRTIVDRFTPWHLGTGLAVVATVVYWVNGLLLFMVDMVVRRDVLEKSKLQPGKNFDKKLFAKVCKNLLIGQVFVFVPYALICALMSEKFSKWGFGVEVTNTLPSPRRMLVETIFVLLFNEVTFYYGHWALHSKIFGVNLYAKIHKVHHEFSAPIGLVASYAHPIEVLVSNAFPLTFGLMVCNAHIYTSMVWGVFAVLGTQFHHGGYRWPWVPALDHQPDFHDFHHQTFTCNYGMTGWLDRLHGTDKAWQEHLKKKTNKPESLWSKFNTFASVVAFAGALVAKFAA